MPFQKVTLLAGIVLSFFISGCSSTAGIFRYNVPDITDANIFPTATIHKPQKTFNFYSAENQMLPPAVFWANGKKVDEHTSVEDFLEKNATTAFIVIRNDSILYEKYFDGYSREKQSQVFSVTKSVISALVGIAISEGHIKNVDQPVSDFLPYYKDNGHEKLTLDHLLQMTAGLSFTDYKTLGKLINLYYTKDQESLVKRIGQKYEPGTRFAYSSIATQVLGMCLEKAIGRPVTNYLQEKLWEPLGMEYNAEFALDDEEGTAKMFGGLTASAIDLAKLGRLYLNKGNWNGKQLIPEEWVLASRQADTTNGRSKRYAYSWWLDTYTRKIGYCENDFFAGGFRGQVVYVNPNDNTIIVRLGKRENGVFWPHALSKLALIQDCESNYCQNEEMLSLEGDYKGKNGKSLNLKLLDDLVVLVDFATSSDNPEKIELKRTGKFSYANKERNVKVIIDYRDKHIKGLIVEQGENAEFLEKI